MKTLWTAIVFGLLVTGCTADLDQVMGRVDGTPTTQPAPEQKIHCDLIFPGVDRR